MKSYLKCEIFIIGTDDWWELMTWLQHISGCLQTQCRAAPSWSPGTARQHPREFDTNNTHTIMFDPLSNTISHWLGTNLESALVTLMKLHLDVFFLNSLWSSDAIWWHRSGSPLAQVIAFLPDGTKPLPEPVLTYNQWSLVAPISQKQAKISIHKMSLKNTLIKFLPHLPGSNELTTSMSSSTIKSLI